MTPLPDGWSVRPLAEVVNARSGNSKIIKGKQSPVPAEGLYQGVSASGPDVWVRDAEYAGPGIVLSAVGARCGKTFLLNGEWTAIANTHVLVPSSAIDSRYLWHLTNNERFWIRSGSAQPFVKVKATLARPQLLPPLLEQRRIVDILEDHLSRLDAGRVYRQSAQQRAKVMTRSLASRHFSGHDEVPLATLLESSIGGVWGSAPGVDDIDVDVLRVTELRQRGQLDPTTAAQRSVTASQLSSRELRAGDLLLEKSGGGPRQPVGRVGIVTGLNQRSVCSNFMQLMRPDTSIADPRFLHLYLNHLHDRGGTMSLQKASTNIRNLKASEYLQLPVPRPDLPTQDAVVAVLTRHEEALDRLAASNEALARREESLRRALLTAAFSGRLSGRASDMDRVDELVMAGSIS